MLRAAVFREWRPRVDSEATEYLGIFTAGGGLLGVIAVFGSCVFVSLVLIDIAPGLRARGPSDLPRDVIGRDTFGGLIRCRSTGDHWTANSDGADRQDNGGRWEDIGPGYRWTLRMRMAYHPVGLPYFTTWFGSTWGLYILSVARRRRRLRAARVTAARPGAPGAT